MKPDQATVEKVGTEGCVNGPNRGSIGSSHLKEKGEDGDEPNEAETHTGDPWSPFNENVVDEPEDVDEIQDDGVEGFQVKIMGDLCDCGYREPGSVDVLSFHIGR